MGNSEIPSYEELVKELEERYPAELDTIIWSIMEDWPEGKMVQFLKDNIDHKSLYDNVLELRKVAEGEIPF